MNIIFDLIIIIFIIVSLCSNHWEIALVFLVFGFIAELSDHQRKIEVLKDKLDKKLARINKVNLYAEI